jgi:hypothetical protein
MPTEHKYVVTVDAQTPELADRVINERIDHDEDLGFDYSVRWEPQPSALTVPPRPATPRFHLDDIAARIWLQQVVVESEADAREDVDSLDGFTLYESWLAAEHSVNGDGPRVGQLLGYAVAQGCLTQPDGMALAYEEDAGADTEGYWWLVLIGSGNDQIRLLSPFHSMSDLGGDSDLSGAAAALAVLQEAVEAVNAELNVLDAYVAARTA